MIQRLKSVLRRYRCRRSSAKSDFELRQRARLGLGRTTAETLAEVDRQLAATRARLRRIESLTVRRRRTDSGP